MKKIMMLSLGLCMIMHAQQAQLLVAKLKNFEASLRTLADMIVPTPPPSNTLALEEELTKIFEHTDAQLLHLLGKESLSKSREQAVESVKRDLESVQKLLADYRIKDFKEYIKNTKNVSLILLVAQVILHADQAGKIDSLLPEQKGTLTSLQTFLTDIPLSAFDKNSRALTINSELHSLNDTILTLLKNLRPLPAEPMLAENKIYKTSKQIEGLIVEYIMTRNKKYGPVALSYIMSEKESGKINTIKRTVAGLEDSMSSALGSSTASARTVKQLHIIYKMLDELRGI